VIIPLEEHRGRAVPCIRAWAEQQDFPREQFELVVASPPHYPPAELEELRSLLARHDRLLYLERDHDMDLCAEAVEVARGEWLFFTESHCFPEPQTLARADEAARLNPKWAGFSCRSVPVTENLLSKIEAESYGRDIEFGMIEHPWRKVLDQCFVVRKRAYFEAGGFDPSFGHFAEWLIAARFHALGLTIGYAPEARIHHVYSGKFDEWRRFTADFVEGQMRYVALEPADPLVTMFDEVPEWSMRHQLDRAVALRVCRMLLRDLRRSRSHGPRLSWPSTWPWNVLRGWLWRGVAGQSSLLIPARFRRLSARLALQMHLLLGNRSGAEESLAKCCAAIATVERTKFLRRWVRGDQDNARGLATEGATVGPVGVWKPGLVAENRGVGFHLASGDGDDATRWSEPAAYVELPIPAGRYEIELKWLFRPLMRGGPLLNFYLDERPLASEDVRILDDRAQLQVEIPDSSQGPARIGWVCSAHYERGDHRTLGLPVTSLTWIRRRLTHLVRRRRIGRLTSSKEVRHGLESQRKLRRDVLVRLDLSVQCDLRPRRDVRLLPRHARLQHSRRRDRGHRHRRAQDRCDCRHAQDHDRGELAAGGVRRRERDR
jgi:hypothetical protein